MRSPIAPLTRRLRGRRHSAAEPPEPASTGPDPAESEPAASAPTESRPTGSEPTATEPAESESAPTDPVPGPDADAAGAVPAGAVPPRRGRLVLVLVVATVVAAGAAGTAWYGHHRAGQRDVAVRQALAAATPAAKAIFSYDYRSFDVSVANGRTFVTGQFADEYAKTTSTLKPTAVSEQAVVLAEVSAAAVIDAGPGRVELLVFLNQYRRNVNTAGEKVDQNRVVLELVPDHGDWKVAEATAI